jgi:4-aminobutyrate aminotransferase-like enzyme
VTEAVARQARTLNTNMRYLHETVIELAERLVASMPEGSGLDTVLVVNSGSEANEIAWRLAKAWTGNDGGIVTEFAYHGVTSATADLSPEEWLSARRPPHVETIPAPDSYRDRLEEPKGWAERAAEAVVAATERLAARDRGLAMTLIDGGLASDGILTPPHAFLREVERLTHQARGLYVADEVQVGHGRTGEHLWSFAGAGLRPDVVTLGKPMGNGHPVAAVITRAEIAARLGEEAEFFSTFGGNPVAAAAALAVLDVIRDQDLVRRAAEVGAELQSALAALAERHPAIGEVRGRGLLVGVDLVEDRGSREPASELAAQVQNALRERGVLVGTTGPRDNVLKLRPPLVFSREHARIVADALDQVLP